MMEEDGGLGRVYRTKATWGARSSGGGTGNPGGYGAIHTSGNTINAGNSSDYKGNNGTGGLLIIYSDNYINNNIIESKGVDSTNKISPSGGASGGGSINIFYNTFVNNKSCLVNGGSSLCYGGAGGNGSVSMGSVLSGSYK